MNVPGIVLFHKFKTRNSTLSGYLSINRELIFGILVWHYIFVMGSIMFDIARFSVLLWFNIFGVLSGGILLWELFSIFRIWSWSTFRAKDSTRYTHSWTINLRFSQEAFFYGMVVVFGLLLIVYIALGSFFQPILTNWDAVAVYLPVAKSILLTGSMRGDTLYAPGDMAKMPPLVPLMYAWIMFWSSSTIAVRFISITYLLLDVLIIYETGKLLVKNRYGGMVASILYLAMPSTQYLFIKEGLYLEPALTFYLMASIYGTLLLFRTADACNKNKEESKHSNLMQMIILFTAISLGLSALTKEMGIVLGFLIVGAFTMLITRTRWLFTLVAYFPLIAYYLLYAKPLLPLMEEFSNVRILLIVKFSILIMFLIISFTLSILSFRKIHLRVRFNEIALLLIPLLFSSLYYINNFVSFGVITSHYLDVEDVSQKMLESYGLVYHYNPTVSIGSYCAFDKAFLSFFGGGMILPALLLGLFKTFKEKENEMIFISLYLIFSLCIWSLYFQCPYKGQDYRFLYYLNLPMLLLSVYGIFATFNKYPADRITNALVTAIVVAINLAAVWFLFINGLVAPTMTLLDLSFREPSITDVAVLAIPWLLFDSIKEKIFSRPYRKIKKILLIVCFLFLIMMSSYLIGSQISFVKNWLNKVDPNEINAANVISPYYDAWIEVADYYKTEITDNYTTLSYGMEVLRYFINKPFLNIQYKDILIKVAPDLLDNNLTNSIRNLYEKKVKYILLPKNPDDILKYYAQRSPLLGSLYTGYNRDLFLSYNFTTFVIEDNMTPYPGKVYSVDIKNKRIVENNQSISYYHDSFDSLKGWNIYGSNRTSLEIYDYIDGPFSIRINGTGNSPSGIYKYILPPSGNFYLSVWVKVEAEPTADEIGLYFYTPGSDTLRLVVAFDGDSHIEVRNYVQGENRKFIGNYSFYEWYNICVDFNDQEGKASVWVFNSQGRLISSIKNLNVSNDRASRTSNGKLLIYSGIKFIGSSLWDNLTVYEKKILFYGIPGFRVSILDAEGNLLLNNADYNWSGKMELNLTDQMPTSCKIMVYIPTYTVQIKKEFTTYILFEINKTT